MALQRGLQKASKMLAAEVKVRRAWGRAPNLGRVAHARVRVRSQAVAKPVDSDEDVLNIATIATGSEGMGRTIASCFKRVSTSAIPALSVAA